MWYVRIDGIPEGYLEFLGYQRISEDVEFCLYRDIQGDEQIVQKSCPRRNQAVDAASDGVRQAALMETQTARPVMQVQFKSRYQARSCLTL